MSQFCKFCYGTGDIGKFLKGENIPNFVTIYHDDMDYPLSINNGLFLERINPHFKKISEKCHKIGKIF